MKISIVIEMICFILKTIMLICKKNIKYILVINKKINPKLEKIKRLFSEIHKDQVKKKKISFDYFLPKNYN